MAQFALFYNDMHWRILVDQLLSDWFVVTLCFQHELRHNFRDNYRFSYAQVSLMIVIYGIIENQAFSLEYFLEDGIYL